MGLLIESRRCETTQKIAEHKLLATSHNKPISIQRFKTEKYSTANVQIIFSAEAPIFFLNIVKNHTFKIMVNISKELGINIARRLILLVILAENMKLRTIA